jgi:hypothetical protein
MSKRLDDLTSLVLRAASFPLRVDDGVLISAKQAERTRPRWWWNSTRKLEWSVLRSRAMYLATFAANGSLDLSPYHRDAGLIGDAINRYLRSASAEALRDATGLSIGRDYSTPAAARKTLRDSLIDVTVRAPVLA